MSFSNALKWKVKVKLLSRVRLFETPWTAAYQAPPSNGIFQARVLEWVAIAFNTGRCEPRQIRITACVKLTEDSWYAPGIWHHCTMADHTAVMCLCHQLVLFENHKLLRLELAWVEASLKNLWGSQLEGKSHLAWLLQRKDFVGACNVTSLLMGIFSLLSLDCILCYHKS